MGKEAYTLSELAELTSSRLSGDGTYLISNVADLESATPTDASFLSNPKYAAVMKNSKAGVIFINDSVECLDGRNYLITKDPSLAFQILVETFYDDAKIPSGFPGIHPSAVIHPTAKIGSNVQIGPFAVIEQYAQVGDRTIIGPHTYLGPKSTLGNDCLIHPNVTIRERCSIGNRVIIQPGAVIGSCGFGYITNAQGHHVKLDQLGTVTIEDDVEIGANTTIDRARFKTTKVSRGTKVDNLVQLGHGVVLGEDNMIVAQVGIAGSTETGRHVVLGGKAAIAGHIKLDSGVRVAGFAGVSKSLPKGDYNGIPAIPVQDYNRNAVLLRNMQKFVDRLKKLEEKLK
ncbi:MAG: UDP-3-O-(3-hydroxymyristoyl)glucosamine N-acyltransferase [Parachlamydiaceae bacterium]